MLQRADQEEKLRQAEWERQQNANARAGLLLEREMERKRRELERQQAEENRRLAKEQKGHLEFLDKEVYTNPPTASYFMQFNTSTRYKCDFIMEWGNGWGVVLFNFFFF